MPLNEQLTWNEVGAISTGGSGTVADFFRLGFGLPAKELLPAGMSLDKFNGFSSLGHGQITAATPLSPWWSPTPSFRHDAGLEQRQKIADANGNEGRSGAGGLPGGGTRFYIPDLAVGDIVDPSFRPL